MIFLEGNRVTLEHSIQQLDAFCGGFIGVPMLDFIGDPMLQ